MEVRKGYKQTEVGIIPDDWQVVPLSKIATEIGDGIHSTPTYVDSSEYFFVNGNNLTEGGVQISTDTKCVSRDEFLLLRKPLTDRTILMSINGTIGNLAFYRGEQLVLGKSAAYINLNTSTNKVFIYHLLQSKAIISYYENELTGTTIRNLSLKTIRDTPVPLPKTAEEQIAIATALSDADALISSLEKLIANKRNIKQGAMQQLLQPKKGWEVKKLGDFLDYEQPTNYLVKNTEYDDNNQIPVLTAGKTFILGYTNEEFGIFRNLPVIIFDDFTTAIKYVDFPFKAKSSAMKMLVPRYAEVNLRFIYEVMQQLDYPLGDHKRHWIGEYQHIEIKVPNKNEQKRIADILFDMDTQITTLEAKLKKCKQIKQGMMQQLLTGKIRLV